MTGPTATGRTAFRLLDGGGKPYWSEVPGTLGGHRRGRLYGRLDCPSALRALARGGYADQRVFFADRATARRAGYRPCAVCLPGEYARWKEEGAGPRRSPLLRSRPEPSDLRPPLAHTRAELAALLRLLAAERPRVRAVAVGRARFAASAAAAAAFADAWGAAGGEVAAVVDWPEQAASWLRPARRLTACSPDAWVIAGTARGWAQLSRRLRLSTDWDPRRTFAFASLAPDRVSTLAGADAVEGLRGVTGAGEDWEIGDGRT